MLSQLRVRNYKSYLGSTLIPLSQITVFLGKNNSGKTTAARLPLAILGALSAQHGNRHDLIPLKSRGLTFGSSLLEMTHGSTPHSGLGFGISATSLGDTVSYQPQSVDFDIQLNQSPRVGVRAFVSRFIAEPAIDPIHWMPGRSAPSDIVYDKAVGFRGVLPFGDDQLNKSVDRLQLDADDELRSILHLTALRASSMTVYEPRRPDLGADTTGSEAPYLIGTEPDLEFQVSEWYRDHLQLSGLAVDSGSSAFTLTSGPLSAPHNLARSGQGLQQVLPVVTYLKAMQMDLISQRLLVLEEPELHLHPSAHGELADLVLEATSKRSDVQVIIETHSENFVLRLRRRIAEGLLDTSRVKILFFSERSGSTEVQEVELRADGSVTSWPRGIFEEDLREVRAIARANAR